MNSFIPWVGGKGKLLWIINKMAPYHYRRFIDVFGGSGTVTMNRPIRHGCIEDSTERFFKHETQMSALIGGENEGYERFHEFIDYDNTPENQAIEEMVFQSLRNVLDLLPPKDYELVYELYFKNRTERECAQKLGMSQQAVHERKKRILKKIKNNLDEEGC